MLNRDRRYSILRRRLFRWHKHAKREFPWRQTEDRYRVLVGELLLQRTRGENVVAVYEDFVSRWPDVAHLSEASSRDVRAVIRPLGLAGRADTLMALAAQVSVIGRIPDEPAELSRLAGVGPYVSHAVPVFADHRNLPLVDWVIARVLRRYFDLPQGRRPNADPDLWALAAALVRPGRARETWLAVLDLAAALCTRRPKCTSCPLSHSCAYPTGAVRS
jgi:A/G-specific adenine glycosylase